MYVLILLLVPFLYLFNPYLALGGLIAAIVAMVVTRTRAPKRPKARQASDSMYKAGYEN